MLTAVYIQERKQNQYDNHQHPFHSGGHLHPPALIRPGICLQYAVFRQGHLLRREIQERQQDQRHSSMRTQHRRGTMEAADVLYGVTMQEDGVSKLLKLDLEQVDATLVS